MILRQWEHLRRSCVVIANVAISRMELFMNISATWELIPPVATRHLIAARLVAISREQLGDGGELVGLAALTLIKRVEPSEMVKANFRLVALGALLSTNALRYWVIKRADRGYFYRDVTAVMGAAAHAPLAKVSRCGRFAFDRDTFLSIVLEGADAKGSA